MSSNGISERLCKYEVLEKVVLVGLASVTTLPAIDTTVSLTDSVAVVVAATTGSGKRLLTAVDTMVSVACGGALHRNESKVVLDDAIKVELPVETRLSPPIPAVDKAAVAAAELLVSGSEEALTDVASTTFPVVVSREKMARPSR